MTAVLIQHILNANALAINHWRIQGARGMCSLIAFISMQFSAIIMPYNRVVPSPPVIGASQQILDPPLSTVTLLCQMNIALTLLTCKFLTSDILLKIRCPRGLRSCSQHSGVSSQRSPCDLMGFLSLRASISAVVYMQIEPAFSALNQSCSLLILCYAIE